MAHTVCVRISLVLFWQYNWYEGDRIGLLNSIWQEYQSSDIQTFYLCRSYVFVRPFNDDSLGRRKTDEWAFHKILQKSNHARTLSRTKSSHDKNSCLRLTEYIIVCSCGALVSVDDTQLFSCSLFLFAKWNYTSHRIMLTLFSLNFSNCDILLAHWTEWRAYCFTSRNVCSNVFVVFHTTTLDTTHTHIYKNNMNFNHFCSCRNHVELRVNSKHSLKQQQELSSIVVANASQTIGGRNKLKCLKI